MRIAFPAHSETQDIRDGVRQLCSKFSLDYWDACDREERFPIEFREAFVSAGFGAITIPEEFGGAGGTLTMLAAALEEVAYGGGALSATASVHIPLLCVPTLLKYGTDRQRRELLPKVASGELFVTFGVTEPDAGTDTTRISTKATKTDGGWVINGAKVWNSGALVGDQVMVLARTSEPGPDGRKGDGLTLFMAPLSGDSIDIRPISKIGRRAVASCEVFFNNHAVTDEDVVGEIGKGFYHLLSSLNGERLLLASEALGMGRWAIEAGSHYAQERVVFNRPIGMNQAVQHPLADGYLRLLAASEVVSRALTEYESGADLKQIGALANAAKYVTTEASFACQEAAMQTFGGYSFAREYHIGRYWTESRLQRIAPVNNQMILNFVAENQLDLPRSY